MAPAQTAAAYLLVVLAITAYHTPAAAQPTCGGSNPIAICYAAPLRGNLGADCTALNTILTQSIGLWNGACSTTPPAPFDLWPVVSSHAVFYSCLTDLALTSGNGQIAYAVLVARAWSVHDVMSSTTLATGLRNMYAGASVPPALWLSFSCKAPRLPTDSSRAIGRFIYTGNGFYGFQLSPPPPRV